MPGPPPKVSDREMLEIIRLHPDAVVTASDVAEETEYTSENVNERLKNLSERGLLRKKKVGSAAAVYWLTDAGKQYIADQES